MFYTYFIVKDISYIVIIINYLCQTHVTVLPHVSSGLCAMSL